MGYQIDIAFDMGNVGSMTEVYHLFTKKAEKNNCEMYYINYEINGVRRRVLKNQSVMTFFFPPEEQNIINFIRFAREFNHSKIESITFGDIKCKLIYASSSYLAMMEKSHVKNYKKSRHLLSNIEKSIINEI